MKLGYLKMWEMPCTYFRSREFFLRILGAINLAAFVSFWIQVDGLIGSNGILPVKDFLELVSRQVGFVRYWELPTLCWLNSSDAFLHFLCGAGAFLSIVLIFGIAPAPVLFFLWVLHLSLVNVGQDFLEFQWDNLLLEVGFLAIFLAPLRLRPRLTDESPPPKLTLWFFGWLLFRLMFSSGLVKFTSGDPTWRSLTALQYHYETQPLPTWIGWYAHQLPAWFQKFSCGVMFAIEGVVPFFIFGPRPFRLFASSVLIGFQILILLTGNYCFFNLLTIALCLLLIDDDAWPLSFRAKRAEGTNQGSRAWPSWAVAPVMILILLVSANQMTRLLGIKIRWPEPVPAVIRTASAFRSVNGYGLFAVMTTSRPEIIVEGSNDGITWRGYEFKWKPGDVSDAPRFNLPHQPRLDWQMWFAALGSYRQNPWFINFLKRLLEGSPPVLKLLEKNPFPDFPPRYVRAIVYDYRFTDLLTLRARGEWWRRSYKGLYCPVISRVSVD